MDIFWHFLYFLYVVAMAGSCCWGLEQLTQEEYNRLERLIAESVRCSNGHAASVVLVRNTTIVYKNGYGQGIPIIDDDTLFCIGGLTKLFTAVLLSQVIGARNSSITFDTPIRQILGDRFWLRDEYRSEHVSLRDILSQRTGISNMDAIPQMNAIKAENMMSHFLYSPEAFDFRKRVYKSDPLFFVVEKVIEKLGGKPYEKLLKEYILEPLGMTGTTFLHTLHSGRRNLAMPTMTSKGKRYTVPIETMRGFKLTRAANGLCSNAADMASWLNMHLMKGVSSSTQNTIVNPEFLDLIYEPGSNQFSNAFNLVKDTFLQPAVSVSFARNGYAMGWETGLYRGFDLRTHSGSIPGYESMLSILPDQLVGVYFSLTGVGGSRATVIKTLFNIFALDLLLGKRSWINYTNVCLILDDLVANLERKAYLSRPPFTPHIWTEGNDQEEFRKEIYAATYKNRMFGDVTISYNETSEKLSLTYGRTGFYELYRTSSKDVFLLQPLQGLPYYISHADGYHGVLYEYLYFNRTSSNNNNNYNNDNAQNIVSVTIPDFDPQTHPTFSKMLKPINMLEKYKLQYLSSHEPILSPSILLLLSLLISIALINSLKFNSSFSS